MPRTHRSIASLAIVCLAGVAAGCTAQAPAKAPPSAVEPSPAATTATPAPRYKPVGSTDAWLVVGQTGQDGLQVIQASNREKIADLPLGVPDSSWATLVATTTSDGSTTVQEMEVMPEPPGRSRTLKGEWRLPTVGLDPLPAGVSGDGRTIVLVEGGAAGASDDGLSRFAILSRGLASEPRVIALKGAFDYDALSPDGSTLYVVEHLAAPPVAHYQVRAVDTASGTLRDGVVVDKAQLDEAMAGYPIAQLRRPDGFVFTLYRGAEYPFIHALSSVDSWALCIDLPARGADDTEAAVDWGLTASADGHAIYAVNATLGLVTEVDASDLSVRRTAQFDAPRSAAITLAKFGHESSGPVGRRLVTSPDGASLYAAGAGGIVRIDTANLDATTSLLRGSAVDALALTPDGITLYALVHQGGRIVELDATTGAELGTVPGDGYDRMVAVVPW